MEQQNLVLSGREFKYAASLAVTILGPVDKWPSMDDAALQVSDYIKKALAEGTFVPESIAALTITEWRLALPAAKMKPLPEDRRDIALVRVFHDQEPEFVPLKSR